MGSEMCIRDRVRADTWKGHRLSEMVSGLVTTLRTAHDHYFTVVIWSTPNQDQTDQERRALADGGDNNSRDRDRSDGGGRDNHGCGGGSGGGSGGGHDHGGSSRRSGGGGHSGEGSDWESGNHRRNGAGGRGYGGGGHGRRGGGSGKGSRGKGGHSHSSSGAHHSSSYGARNSSSSEDNGQDPDVTVVRAKRQVVPSPVEVASSAEFLGHLTIADDRAKPVSSNFAHARFSAIEADTAAAEA